MDAASSKDAILVKRLRFGGDFVISGDVLSLLDWLIKRSLRGVRQEHPDGILLQTLCRSGELGTADVFQCFQYRSVIPEIMKLRLKNLK